MIRGHGDWGIRLCASAEPEVTYQGMGKETPVWRSRMLHSFHPQHPNLQKAGRAPSGEAQLEMGMKQEPPTTRLQVLKSIFPQLVPMV